MVTPAKITDLERELERLRAEVAEREAERFRVRVAPPRRGRDRGCWVLRVTGPGISKFGRRELTDVPHADETRRQAEGLALVRQARLNGEGLTLAEVLAQFAAARASRVSESTQAGDRAAARRLELTGCGALRDPMRGSEVLDLRDRIAEHYRASTARLIFGRLKTAWRWALARDLVASPWPTLPRKRTTREDKCQKRAFSEAEVADLLAHLASYRGGIYLGLGWALAETAARISELLALQVADAVEQADGSAELLIGRRVPTKTGEPRRASISPALVRALGLPRDPGAPLFPSQRDPGRAVPRGTFTRVVARWVRSVGLEGKRDAHSFRRRGAVTLHRAGVPVELAKRVTGHESSAVFLSYAERGDYRLDAERKLLWLDPTADLEASA